MRRKIRDIALAFGILAGTLSLSTPASADDITGIKLEAELREMIEIGVMQGYSEGEYRPNEQVSRGQFAAFISRALDLPKGSGHFRDVPTNLKLADSIYRAAAAGIVTGYTNGNFGIDDKITREQMAAMIDRSMDYLNIPKERATVEFTDMDKIGSSQFALAVSYSVNYGIIQGFPDNSFRPKANATRAQAAAFISRLLGVYEDHGGVIDRTPEYQLASIINGQLSPKQEAYETYAEAVAAMAPNDVVMQGAKIVKMNSGIVFAKKSPTVIRDGNLRDVVGIQVNSEMKYLESDETRVKVQIADTVGYVNLDDVTLVPTAMITGQAYYMNENGSLVHYIYRNGNYEKYTYGVAPAFLSPGQKYYSLDGDTFTTANGATVGEAYQYFNVLSLRTKTNYTAEELNAYVAQNYPTSPLKDLGAALKEAEATYHVNALYILAKAANESTWGTSAKAKTLKNLFGVGVYDSDPNSGQAYPSFKDSIMYFAKKVSTEYLTPAGKFYYGAIPGDKHWGVNVKYATDPYSEQKVAGIMYRIDKALGQKDWLKYQIAEVTGLDPNYSLRARPEPNTSQAAYYMYPGNGFPLTIIEKTGTWYKIVSDMADHEYAYVSGDYVKMLPIAGK